MAPILIRIAPLLEAKKRLLDQQNANGGIQQQNVVPPGGGPPQVNVVPEVANENPVLANQVPVNLVQNANIQLREAQNLQPVNAVHNVLIAQNQNLPGYVDNARYVQQPNMDDWRHFLRALVRNNLQLPEFAGQDHEDPENFLRECEQGFNATNTEMHMRARLASRALKEDAARWFAVYKSLSLT